MNQLSLNAIALSLFGMTLFVLVGPFLNISPLWSVGTILLVLSAVTVDAFQFQSVGLTLLLDAIAQKLPPYRNRVVCHEAGHFLVATLLELPIETYTLSVWEAMRQDVPHYGGVVLQTPDGDSTEWLKANIEKLCAVWVAGGIAEELTYGSSQGDADDLQQLRQTLKRLGLSLNLYEQKAKRLARQLLQTQQASFQALIPKLAARDSVSECCQVIQQ
ncbi:MAG TPA: ATP-dependent Zn protease, partial [Stenomitos sp.]